MTLAAMVENLVAAARASLNVVARRSSKCIYSATFGSFSVPSAPDMRLREEFDFVLFTDNPEESPEGWHVVRVDTCGVSARLANRMLKWFGPRIFEHYDWVVYVDSNIELEAGLEGQLRLAQDGFIAVPRHPFRRSVFEEVCECYASNRIRLSDAFTIIGSYRKSYDFFCDGLTENNLVVFNVMNCSSPAIAALHELAAALIRGPQRDQLHFLPIFKEHGIEVVRLPESARTGSWGRYSEHRISAAPPVTSMAGAARRWAFSARRMARLCFWKPMLGAFLALTQGSSGNGSRAEARR